MYQLKKIEINVIYDEIRRLYVIYFKNKYCSWRRMEMVKKLKRFSAIIIAAALIISLAPQTVFASDTIVLDFNKTTLVTGSHEVTADANFEFVAAESAKPSNLWATHVRFNGYVQGSSNEHYPWLYGVSKNAAKTLGKVRVRAKVPAGNYEVKYRAGKTFMSGMQYIYVNGKYMGLFDSYIDDTAIAYDKAVMEEKSLGTVSVTPDSDGYADIQIASAAVSRGAVAKTHNNGVSMLPSRITLTPVEAVPTVSAVECEIPSSIKSGESVDIYPKVLLSDGTYKELNGYDADGKADADNCYKITVSGGAVEYKQISNPLSSYTMYETGGRFAGRLTAVKPGTATVTVTATVDGVAYTKTADVRAVREYGETIELKFNSSTLTRNSYATSSTAGFEAVETESTKPTLLTADYARFNAYIWGKTNAHSTWVYGVFKNAAKTLGKYRIKADVPAGNYEVKYCGGKSYVSGMQYIYVNGKYMGLFDSYVDDTGIGLNNAVLEEKTLGVVSVTPDSDGLTEIQVANAAVSRGDMVDGVNNGTSIILSKITLTPVSSVPTVSGVECEIPSEIKSGESVDIYPRVLLSDGTYKELNGYDADGHADASNALSVSVSGDALNYTQVSNPQSSYTMYETNGAFKGTLTAASEGKSTVSVKAVVNGVTYTKDVTVTVPSSAAGEEVSGSVNVYVDAENGGKVSGSVDIGTVNALPFGTSVTVTAEDVEGKQFAYWRNSAGSVLGSDKTYTFKANTNTSVIAVYDDESSETQDSVNVYFYNGNRELLSSKSVSLADNKTFGDIKISDPSLTGYVFYKWSVSDDTVIKELTRAVAIYADSPSEYTLTFEDSEGEHVYSGKKYAEAVTHTASGDNFSCWKLGDGIIGYDKTITVYAWKNAVVTAVYGSSDEAIPSVVLSYDNGAYFMIYNVPAGYTKVEAGILFSASGTPTIGSYGSKAFARREGNNGQFTASPYSESQTTARAYLIFRDGDGVNRVIYSK